MKIRRISHRNNDWYGLQIEKSNPNIEQIRQHSESVWSQTKKMWLFPVSTESEVFLRSIYNREKNEQIPPKTKLKGPKYQRKAVLVIRKSNYIKLSNYPGTKVLELLKAWRNCRYYPDTKSWLIPYHPKRIETLAELLKDIYPIIEVVDERKIKAKKASIKLDEHKRKCPLIMTEKLIEMRYSKSTVKTYCAMMDQFLTHYYTHKPEEITTEMIRAYLRYLVMEREVSTSFQNQAINAIKFYYEKVLGGQQKTYFIDRPRKERKLPEVLSKTEIVALLKSVKNLKHKAILSTIYAGGLRISEAINLKLSAVDFDEKRLHIKAAKGKKDRYVPLAERSILILKKYLEVYAPLKFMFEGKPNAPYSASSIQKIVKNATLNIGVKKHITPHSLRHSFATHMIESGVNLRYVQQILGHKNSKTTEIYTHITDIALQQITNPLDQLDFD